MDYQKIYNNLVYKSRVFSKGEYFEIHHKIPKSIGGTDDQSNLIKLSAREHYVAHLLLVKIAEKNQETAVYQKMLYAFNCMKWGRGKGLRSFKFNSRLYQKLKERYSKIRSSMMKTMHNPILGKVWIHSDTLRKSMLYNSSESIPEGWKIGRVVNWESHDKKLNLSKKKKKKKKQRIRKEREHKLENRMSKNKQLYTKMYNTYCQLGFDGVRDIFGYRFSQVNFVNQCKRYVDGFVPQNGKKRGIKN